MKKFEECEHTNLTPVHEEPWDDDKYSRGKGLDAYEIKRRWPRQHCLDCGTVYYASYLHYIAGDW